MCVFWKEIKEGRVYVFPQKIVRKPVKSPFPYMWARLAYAQDVGVNLLLLKPGVMLCMTEVKTCSNESKRDC